jgi:heme exporter protein A
LVVVGPNGSGKSTLLNLLAGTLRPSRGGIEYRRDEAVLPRDAWFAHHGMATPDMAVYEELTALENVMFFARLRGVGMDSCGAAALLERLGLPAREHHRFVRAFSSGMKQRVKLAQAILHRPAVLFLDEPSSNLDDSGHQAVAELVREMRATTAIAVATNDPREVAWGDGRVELAN